MSMTRILRAGADRYRGEARILLADRSRALVEFQVVFLLLFAVLGFALPSDGGREPVLSNHSVLMVFMMLILCQVGTGTVTQSMFASRADGTLLRLRCTPGGLPAFVVEKCLYVLTMNAVALGVLTVLGFAFGTLRPHGSPLHWVSTLVFVLLGVLFFTALGVLLGSLLASAPEQFGYFLLLVMTFSAIAGSGLSSVLPGPMSIALQVMPFEWIAGGIDAGLSAQNPIGFDNGVWHPLLGVLVIGAWTAVILAAALPLTRRMTRKTSGSDMERSQQARREGNPG